MTGGNPRLTMMLYELIVHENIMDVKLQFQKLLDQITPFYQDRLKDLAPQERALLETIALMRTEPSTPAAIARPTQKDAPADIVAPPENDEGGLPHRFRKPGGQAITALPHQGGLLRSLARHERIPGGEEATRVSCRPLRDLLS